MKEMSFEAAIKTLEDTVKKLEKGDLPLDKMIELYDEGLKLSGFCSEKLENAEAKIKIISKEDVEVTE